MCADDIDRELEDRSRARSFRPLSRPERQVGIRPIADWLIQLAKTPPATSHESYLGTKSFLRTKCYDCDNLNSTLSMQSGFQPVM
jgi:hypothetical protein